jgi:DNA end-binding protein Ku
MAVAHKSAIIFDFVYIPVSLYTAVQDNDIHFNQLHKDTKERIQYKKTCPHCGTEVKPEDIVKGYQFGKDRYVVITDEDIERIKTEKDKTIQILQTDDPSGINPVLYNKTYNVVPDLGGERAFELLRLALLEENKIAIAKTVLGTSETMMTIAPTSAGMMINTLYYIEDVRDFPVSHAKTDVNSEELEMTKSLVRSIEKHYEPELHHDDYQLRLREMINAKIYGEDYTTTDEKAPRVINLLDALKASVEKEKSRNAL